LDIVVFWGDFFFGDLCFYAFAPVYRMKFFACPCVQNSTVPYRMIYLSSVLLILCLRSEEKKGPASYYSLVRCQGREYKYRYPRKVKWNVLGSLSLESIKSWRLCFRGTRPTKHRKLFLHESESRGESPRAHDPTVCDSE
jgi:hypothetical protein